ncbi:hypothetical protein [Parasphingorhabdus sp.]|uniref:hypothetical protein n=1 Tax=Parasphingorhabdus sp. TaxID=2709688 RepID=UPI003A8DF85D
MRLRYLNRDGTAGLRCGLYAILFSGFLPIGGAAVAQITESEIAAPDVPDTPEAQAEMALLDTEIMESTTEQSALQLAQRQIDAKDLSGAATTLERYLITDPESQPARIEYAIALCRLDDLQAGHFEVAKMQIPELDQPTVERIQSFCQLAPSQMNNLHDQ